MSRHRVTVVLSQAQGKHPAKRALEESIVAALILEPGLDVSVVPYLYDLGADHTGRLFLESVRAVARQFPDIAYDEKIIDAACMHLVMNPGQFDVLVLPNLYGDIASDLCAGLVGGLGVVGAANLGTEIGVFEAVHGSAPDIAGQNIANPTALLLSAVLMLRHIGEGAAANRVMSALGRVLIAGTTRTRDLGGTASTSEFADAVCTALN